MTTNTTIALEKLHNELLKDFVESHWNIKLQRFIYIQRCFTMFRNLKNAFKMVGVLFLVILTTFIVKPDAAVAATFRTVYPYQFTFINHTSDIPIFYDLDRATGGDLEEISGVVEPGQTVQSQSFDYGGRTLEQGNVPVITIVGAPAPKFRFWSGSDGQYINAIAKNEYTVTTDTSEISEIIGNGYRVTVDGGGTDDPTTSDIYIQVYDN